MRRKTAMGILVLAAGAGCLGDESPAAALRRALGETKVGLPQVIANALEQSPGANVIEASLEWHQTRPRFGVTLLVAGSIRSLEVDALGAVVRAADEELEPAQRRELDEIKPALAAARLTAAQALHAAARAPAPSGAASGPAASQAARPVGVELDVKAGQARWVVTLFSGTGSGTLIRVEVDSVSGQTLSQAEEALPLALWTFDTDAAGQMPADVVAKETNPGPHTGIWKVTADPTAPTKPNVLALTTSESGSTFNLALFERTAFRDLDIRVRVKANSGKEDQGGGLIWRGRDETNYYICRINPLENNFRVYKVVEGKRTQLQSAEFQAQSGRWYQVRAVMAGDAIQCYVDGKQYLDVKDDTFREAGKIGLWTKADASSAFDSLAVYAPQAQAGH